jgi:hypothetical protein
MYYVRGAHEPGMPHLTAVSPVGVAVAVVGAALRPAARASSACGNYVASSAADVAAHAAAIKTAAELSLAAIGQTPITVDKWCNARAEPALAVDAGGHGIVTLAALAACTAVLIALGQVNLRQQSQGTGCGSSVLCRQAAFRLPCGTAPESVSLTAPQPLLV